jgi:hypothetical protein
MHPGLAPSIPLAANCPLDLRGELKQQTVVRLLRLRLDTKRQPILMNPSSRD